MSLFMLNAYKYKKGAKFLQSNSQRDSYGEQAESVCIVDSKCGRCAQMMK